MRKFEIVLSALDKISPALNNINKKMSRLNKSTLKVRRAFSKLASKGFSGFKKVTGAVINLTKKMALASVASVGIFGLIVRQSLNATDALAKTSRKIGTTAGDLAKLRYAADLTGVSTQTMDMALQRFTRRAAEAAKGTGEAKGALKELKVNADDLLKLPLPEQMTVLATAFEDVEKPADKVRLAMKLFDSEGVALVNTLGLGADALKEMMQEAETLGVVLSQRAAEGVEDTNDSITRLNTLFKGFKDQTVAALAPAIKTVTDELVLLGKEASGGDFENFGQVLAGQILTLVQKVIGAFQKMLNAIGKVVFEISKMVNKIFGDEETKRIKSRMSELERQAHKLGLSFKFSKNVSEENQAILDEYASLQSDLANIEKLEFDPFNFEPLLEKLETVKAKILDATNPTKEGGEGEEGGSEDPLAKKLSAFDKYNQSLRKKGEDQVGWETKTQAEKTKHFLSEQSNLLAGAGKHSKKLFKIQKAASIATAVIKTYEGAQMAMGAYPPPINFAMAAATVAAGMANVAAIKAQSFDGGGFTGNGARAGGVDGKGGFNAILHPNETVIDHTKQSTARGTEQQIIVNQTINVTTGVQSTVRSEIQNMMPQIAESAQNAVLNARMRGGSYSKTLLGK